MNEHESAKVLIEWIVKKSFCEFFTLTRKSFAVGMLQSFLFHHHTLNNSISPYCQIYMTTQKAQQ
jgi:hypothetical protein